MRKFLNEAAERIINNKHFGAQSVVILPNRRSEIFLKREIKNFTTSSIWLPDFYPVDEFIQKASGLNKSENISIFFELYKIHQKIAGNEAKTIDDFLTWAPQILSDFNDIDNSMADARDIFTQLSAVKAIELWNPDGSPLTELQTNYLNFFNSLYEYYVLLNEKLIVENIGYQGQINRYLANNISSLAEKYQWKKFVIVGINAFSEAEIKVFDFINNNFETEFIWDVDDYYFSNKKNNQEAGRNIREIINRLKISEPDNINDNLRNSEKEIKILGVPKSVGQIKFIGQEIQKLFNDKTNNDGTDTYINTAVVLADEGLLIPLLNSLPSPENEEEKRYYNVTLGFPLANSQVEHLFNTWVDILISKSHNNGRILTTSFISLLNNSIIKQLFHNNNISGELLIKHLIINNISSISFDKSEYEYSPDMKKTSEVLSGLLNNNKDESVSTIIERLENMLFSVLKNSAKLNKLIVEQIKQLIKILSKLSILSAQNKDIINITALKKTGKQLISQSNISLIGEPLHGIQIMGMLETRNLDFDNLYILSTNEGILPATANIDSFIPMDIRSENNLPLPSAKSDIYAYHFYRLLQRASNITLIYNSDPGKLGGGEKSRFILQIENELKKINQRITISNKIISTDIPQADKLTSDVIEIKKNDEIKQKLASISISGFSPSVLNSYIKCPLKFYFAHILKIVTSNCLEESVQANTFGTVVHGALEEIYKPMEGKEIIPENIKQGISNINQIIANQFSENYKNGNIKSGKNLLIYEAAINNTKKFLVWEIRYLTKHPIILQSTENKFTTSINTDTTNINFKGIVDRVDKQVSDGVTRIIDYKTGKVLQKDLSVKNTDDLFNDPKFEKAFQVIFYAWLYSRNIPDAKLQTGIISLRSLSEGYIKLNLTDYDNVVDYFPEFTESLLKLVTEISDPLISFTQTNNTERCEWCDYKSICNR